MCSSSDSADFGSYALKGRVSDDVLDHPSEAGT